MALRRVTDAPPRGASGYVEGMEHLVHVVQALSMARSLEQIQRIVRSAARRLTGADGATFVLRDGDSCFYADEDAISPLWKGSRFPLRTCISGWAMLNRQAAVIEDIYADERIPHDVYRPTFVKSLAMVPIRSADPLGAIGAYWAKRHHPTEAEVKLLRALADTTAVAMESVAVYAELEERVRLRTAELDDANQFLREFVAITAHDIRGPLTAIRGAANLLGRDGVKNPDDLVGIIDRQVEHLNRLVGDLVTLSLHELGHLEVQPVPIEVVELARAVVREVSDPVTIDVSDGLVIDADPGHAHRIVANFVHNAVKYGAQPISIEARPIDGAVEIVVRDAGQGVPPDFERDLFTRFKRGSTSHGTEGSGLGLSIALALALENGGDVFYRPNEPRGSSFGVRFPTA